MKTNTNIKLRSIEVELLFWRNNQKNYEKFRGMVTQLVEKIYDRYYSSYNNKADWVDIITTDIMMDVLNYNNLDHNKSIFNYLYTNIKNKLHKNLVRKKANNVHKVELNDDLIVIDENSIYENSEYILTLFDNYITSLNFSKVKSKQASNKKRVECACLVFDLIMFTDNISYEEIVDWLLKFNYTKRWISTFFKEFRLFCEKNVEI